MTPATPAASRVLLAKRLFFELSCSGSVIIVCSWTEEVQVELPLSTLKINNYHWSLLLPATHPGEWR